MTNKDWLTSTDPLALLRARAGPRKRRLFAVCCCRRAWPALADRRSRQAVGAAEQFADGRADSAALACAGAAARCAVAGQKSQPLWAAAQAAACAAFRGAGVAAWYAAWASVAAASNWQEERAAQCRLLRDILGNPFRPPPAIDPVWLAWNNGVVQQLAVAAYQQRLMPSGNLDPARLAVLADALEEAGCTDPALLGHLRGPGPHVRGCHIVDLLLGKS